MLTQEASVSDLEQQIAQLRHALDAQRETVAANAFAHATLAAVSSQICVLDASGVILAVNQAWRDFYALNLPDDGSRLDWIGTNYLAICEAAAGEHSAGATEVADGIRRIIRGESDEFSLDYPCHSPAVQRWFTVRVTRFHDDSGNVVVAHENITARKQAELREAVHSQTMTLMARDASLDEILDALVRGVENSHPGMVASVHVLNAGGTHVQLVAAPSLPPAWRHAVSGLAVAPHGPIVAAFSGEQRLASDIENDPGWAEWRELAACAGLAACWSEPIRGSGGLVLGSFSLYPRQIRSPGNTELAAITAATQLAAVAIEHARAQEKLHTSAHLLDASQQIARMGGWELDVDTRSLYWSEGLYRIHDTSPAEFNPDFEVGISYFPPDSRRIIDAALKVAIETGQGYDLELEKITFKGRRIHVRTTCVVTMRDGRAVKLTGVMQDITEQKQAEAARLELESQLREAQRIESLGTLAGGIAHDFNNILGAIMGNVVLASEELGPAHPARESLDEIGRSSVRARELINQILAFSRRQAQQLVNQPLQPVIEETIRLLRATLPASVHFDLPPVPETLCARIDATQLTQVLINLCTNAWHAMKDGAGHIGITLDEVECDDDPGADADAPPPGRYVRIRVRDDGCGMDAATQARAFEPFFTTKPVGSGTGLGLAVVHGIVKAHHGAISVTSAIGTGSVFEVLLPAVDGAAPAAIAPPAPAAGATGNGRHVLYLDDDESMVLMVTRFLRKRGFRVSGFEVAADALAALAADPDDFDLVVTDFNMPKASGLDVARAIAQIRPALPVVITTGYISEALRDGARRAGVRELLYKPNSVEELAASISRLLVQPVH